MNKTYNLSVKGPREFSIKRLLHRESSYRKSYENTYGESGDHFVKSIFKWIQTMKIAWIKYTAYRFNFFLTVIGPARFLFIKYNLWSSIYDGDTEAIIEIIILPI